MIDLWMYQYTGKLRFLKGNCSEGVSGSIFILPPGLF